MTRLSPHPSSAMKKPLALVALLAGALVLALPLPAQSETKRPREGGKGGGRGPSVEMLTEQLGLTKDQAAKLKPVFEAQRAKFEALRDDQSLSPQERRSRMRSIREEGDAAISAVLTPEQKKKWDEFRASRGRGGPGGERRGPGEGKGDRPKN